MRPHARRRSLAGMLGASLLLLLTSTPATAQTRQPQANKNPDPGTICEFGQPAYGAYCTHSNGHFGYLGRSSYGAWGEHANGHYGWFGSAGVGAGGRHSNGNIGYLGQVDYAVFGLHNNGNKGYLGGEDYGAYGQYTIGSGILNHGYLGGEAYGAYGKHFEGNFGLLGGVIYGVYGNGTPHAGYFQGNVRVTGTLEGGSAASKVDHPLDPADKYLAHSFVESPDMMNVYNGNVVLNAAGEAVVELPSYFEALNRDFRYQLTCIGGFAPVYVAEKISNNRFKIVGGEPGMEVSWQVTGIRQDAWANAHRIIVEEDKPAIERGYYLYPKLYGQPAERSVEWARDPEGMREIKEWPARIEAERRRREEQRQRMEEEQPQIEQEHQRLGHEQHD